MTSLGRNPRNRKRNLRNRKQHAPKPSGENQNRKTCADTRKLENVRKSQHTLHAQIGVLENFLAGKAIAAEKKAQMRQQNILPPPENYQRLQTRHKMSKAERRRYLEEREKGGIKFFILFCIVCALAWWLLKTGL